MINEILYDPTGPDSGFEFVEIANTGPYAATLDGVALDAGNGSKPDDWKETWRGRGDSWIPPGGLYRVGLTSPGEGEPAELGLQNGPDAVRLVKQGFELDRVGWGAHTHPEYFESHPAPLTGSGRSLARRADGVDTQDNAADFEIAPPTPGRPNRPAEDWAIRFGPPSPELPRPGEAILVRLRVVNRGVEASTPPPAEIVDREKTVTVGWSSAVQPGGSEVQVVFLQAPPDTGRALWRARVLSRDPVPENDSDSLALRVGPGCARITEILASPAPGGCEWVEISTSLPEGRILSGYKLDVRGHRIDLAPRAVDPMNRFAVVVEDSVVMALSHPEIPPGSFWPYQGTWPRLRNGDRSDGVSDTLRLLRPDGLLSDIALPGAAPAQGTSLERLALDLPEGPRAWVPSPDPARATPARAGVTGTGAQTESPFFVHPRTVRPGRSTCLFEASLGSHPGEVRLDLFDLEGNAVRCLLRDVWVAGRAIALWDGRDELQRDVEPGLYIAVLEINRGGGEIERRRTAVAAAPASLQ